MMVKLTRGLERTDDTRIALGGGLEHSIVLISDKSRATFSDEAVVALYTQMYHLCFY